MSGTKNSLFNEATRVQMPALVHLTRIGYSYFGKITEDMAGTIYDPDTNILINVFKEQFAKLNPDHAGDAETILRTIRQELDNDDIGESFYKRLKAVSPVRLLDFDNPANNTYHFMAEFTCKRDEDEFRPDITIFINGLPLVFIEVKKPNNIGGMVAEDGFLTNAGALFADDSPSRNSRLFCTRWNGLDKAPGLTDALDDKEFFRFSDLSASGRTGFHQKQHKKTLAEDRKRQRRNAGVS